MTIREPGPTIHLITERTFLVSLAGELDEAAALTVARRLWLLVAEGATEVVVDLLDVTFVDATGLRSLLEVGRRARGLGARLTIVCDDSDALAVLDLVGLRRVIAVEPTVTRAFAAVAARANGSPARAA